MAESEANYRQYAGWVAFPRNPDDLASTAHCPACFTPVRRTACTNCQLDLTHSAAAELATVSADAAGLLDRRLELIGRIRYETSQRLAQRFDAVLQAPVSAPAVASDAPPVVSPVSSPVIAAPSASSASPILAAPAVSSAPSGPRRSSVQIILLVVGTLLLSVAAMFFLIGAFFVFWFIARSLVIVAVTIAALIVASQLRRKSLTATAESIAVFAVVLIYLDAFSLRSNELFELGVNGATYWGATLVISTGIFAVWNRLSTLRTAKIAAFAAFSPGVGLLVGGLSEQMGGGVGVYLAFAATALAAVCQVLAPRSANPTRAAAAATPERMIVLVTALMAVLGAAIVSFFVAPDSDWAPTVALFMLAVISAIHVVLIDRDESASPLRPFGALFAGIAGALAAIAVGFTALRVGDLDFGLVAPPIAAVIVGLGLELAARRMADQRFVGHLWTAAWAAAAVATLALLLPTVVAVSTTVTSVATALGDRWSQSPSAAIQTGGESTGFAVLCLAIVGVLAALAWTTGRVIQARRSALAWYGAAVLVLAVPLLSVLWAVLAGWLVLAAGSLAALITPRSGDRLRYRTPLVALLAASGALAYLTGWASTGTWLIVTLSVIALALLSRLSTADVVGRAALLGAAAVIMLIGGAALARQLARPSAPGIRIDSLDAIRASGLVAIALLAVAACVSGRIASVVDRRTLFWISGVTAAATAVVAHVWLNLMGTSERMTALLPEYGTSLVASAALLTVLILWLTLPRSRSLRTEGIAASIALAPTVYWIVDSFVQVLELPEFARSVAPITAALFASAGALVATLLRPSLPRGVREIGIAIVAVPAVVISVALNQNATWLVFVLAAVTALILAISEDGLFSSVSPRRHLGWLALALAIAGLWWRLFQSQVQAIEPFVLPVAGAFLLISLMLWWANRRRADARPSRAAPFVALGGLLVAILPLGLGGATGPITRAIVVGAVSAALLIIGSVVIGGRGIRPYLDVAALAGAIGVVVVTIGRSVALSVEPGHPDLRLDAWLAAGVLALIVAAFGQARRRDDESVGLRTTASLALGLIAMSSVLLLELSAFDPSRIGSIRALAVVLLFAALHVVAFVANHAPLTRLLGWVSIAFAGVAAIGGLIAGSLAQVELGSVPIALALIATGAIHLLGTPTARTWPWLAPGVLVLLVPSLLAGGWDAPLWRLIALGVVSIAIIVVSVALRLQAPFLIAAAVAVIHAMATFAPEIRTVYESVAWWLWLAIGGVILVTLGATFEKNMKNFQSVAMRIRALR